MADYRNINRQIGIVVLSVNQSVLWDDIQVSDKSTVYICESDQIIAAADPDQIGKSIAVKSQRGYRVLKTKNDKTGWNVYHFYSKVQYDQQIKANICIGLGSMVALMLLSTVLLTFMMRPVLDLVGQLVYAMSEIENGNFDVQIPSVEHPTNEVERIVAGFNEMSGQLKQLVEKVKQSTVDQKNAELQAMEAQIDPHFLYNTLDSIRGQAIINGEKNIAVMLEALANFFRYSISGKENRVTFREEMINMENYIKIQNYRFQGRFTVEVDESARDRDIQDCIVPKLMLQPIVENAILHGLEQKKEGKVLITADVTEDVLLITVSDDGVGMSEEKLRQLNQALEQGYLNKKSKSTHGIALPNVHSRIRTFFGEEYGITVYSTEGKGTDVEILLPRRTGYQGSI